METKVFWMLSLWFSTAHGNFEGRNANDTNDFDRTSLKTFLRKQQQIRKEERMYSKLEWWNAFDDIHFQDLHGHPPVYKSKISYTV